MTTQLHQTDAGTEMVTPFHANWDRVLTEREVGMLAANPYQMFRAHDPARGIRWRHRLAKRLRSVIVYNGSVLANSGG